MKSPILFIVSCVVLLLVLSYPEEAKAASNRCQQRNFFPGKCGNDGIQSCLRDFKKKTKKSHIIDQCSKCENHKSPSGLEQRLCHCSYPSASPCI
ncbi:unnamed protein product [Brassica napus]|nr:unnamed protein product [Brassica napus]CAF2368982.1 unnamed protein product [Brassica napus]CAF2369005.1 unnamed protein product [Brassica napus]